MTTYTVSTGMFRRLSYIPVSHSCGHYEARLTRFSRVGDEVRGYLLAESPCSSCALQGRNVVPRYATLADVQEGCAIRNSEERR